VFSLSRADAGVLGLHCSDVTTPNLRFTVL